MADINVEILVKGVGKLDIISSDVDNFGVPMVFNLTDIKDVSSRRANFTKTIKILGSPNNNKIFNHLYEIKGQNFNFKMTDKHECSILLNKNPVMDGYLVLKSISKLLIGSKYEVVYEVNVFDELKNFFNQLGDKRLIDLDFSSGFTFQGITYDVGNHILNEQILAERMNNITDYTNVYDYPVIDYGYKLKDMLFGLNSPYPRSSTSFGALYPCVYEKPILDNIFYSSNGYTYESNYFDGLSYGGFFKNMINIYNKGVDITNIQLAEYVRGKINITSSPYSVKIGSNDAVISHNGPLYVESYYELDSYLSSLNISGDTTLSDNIITDTYNHIYHIEDTISGATAPVDGDYNIKIRIDVSDDKGGFSYDSSGSVYVGPTGGVPTHYDLIRYNTESDDIILEYTINSFEMRPSPSDTYWYYEKEFFIEGANKGDVFCLFVRRGTIDLIGFPLDQPVDVSLNMVSLEMTYIRDLDDDYATTGITTNPYIELNRFLPDMKQSDFIRNHIKLANLYVWSNKEDPKKLYIEPREDFYKQGELINWSDKVDYNKSIVIKSLSSEISKTFTFEYKEGKDFDSNNYLDIYGDVYGTKDIEVDTNYLINQQKITLDNQSWLMKNYLIPIIGDPDNFLIPKLYEKSDHTWFDDKSEFLPMWGFKDNVEIAVYSLKIASYFRLNRFNAYMKNIPIVSHAKILGGLSFDLNYETNNETFIISNYDSSRGAYKIFWENYINNLIDEDARIVEMYINFDLADILNLDFRDRVLIDGQVYFLEKVEYDPTNKDSSKVTLLKEIDPIESSSFDISYLLKNDSGEYITTSDGTDGLGDGGNKIIIN